MEPIVVPGNLDSLSAIARYAIAAANLADLDREKTYQLRLAIDEIATNIIIHGYEESGLSGVIVLSVKLDDRTLTLCLEDTGAPYDQCSLHEFGRIEGITYALSPNDGERWKVGFSRTLGRNSRHDVDYRISRFFHHL